MDNANKNRDDLLSELLLAHKRIADLEALKASEERYRQIVENANSIIMLMDTKGNITFFNTFAERFFGFTEGQVWGKNIVGTIVSEKDLSGVDLVAMIKDILKNPEKHSVNENENIRANGERVRILWTNKAIVGDDGEVKEILCIGNKVSASTPAA